jgi:hypothetical protein
MRKQSFNWTLFKRGSQLSGAAIFIAQFLILSTLICFTTGVPSAFYRPGLAHPDLFHLSLCWSPPPTRCIPSPLFIPCVFTPGFLFVCYQFVLSRQVLPACSHVPYALVFLSLPSSDLPVLILPAVLYLPFACPLNYNKLRLVPSASCVCIWVLA